MTIRSPDELFSELEELGEDEVRKKVACNAFSDDKLTVIKEWLSRKESERENKRIAHENEREDKRTKISNSAKNAAWVSAAFALLAMLIAGFSFWKVSKLQEYDYTPKLQIMEEEVGKGSDGRKYMAFKYSGFLVNSGLKPVKIVKYYFEYGSEEDVEKRLSYDIFPTNFYLKRTEGNHRISWKLDAAKLKEQMDKLRTDNCHFYLVVLYENVNKEIITKKRHLLSISRNGERVNVQNGLSL